MRFVLSTALSLVVATAAAEPIAFRGVPLGTTLQGLRALPFPDTDTVDDVPTLQCNDFTDSKPYYPEKFVQTMKGYVALGVALCHWESPTGSKARVGIGFFSSDQVTYSVYRAPDGEQRLYQIKIELPSAQAEGLLKNLSDKFGEPTISRSEVHNRMGAAFGTFVATWHQDGDTIKLDQRVGSVDKGVLEYSRDAWVADFNLKLKAMVGDPKL